MRRAEVAAILADTAQQHGRRTSAGGSASRPTSSSAGSALRARDRRLDDRRRRSSPRSLVAISSSRSGPSRRPRRAVRDALHRRRARARRCARRSASSCRQPRRARRRAARRPQPRGRASRHGRQRDRAVEVRVPPRRLQDEQLGIPLDEALDGDGAADAELRRRADRRSSCALQREAGGNTAEVLDRVAENIRGRMELRRLVDVLTAQARISRWILTAPADLRARSSLVFIGRRLPRAAVRLDRRQDRARRRGDHGADRLARDQANRRDLDV